MSKNLFNSIQMTKAKRNFFDLSHDVKLSCNMGELVPFCIMEAVPGDKFKLNGQAVVRFAPLVAPAMHRFNVFMHYFFVPHRILWDKWEFWITRDPQEALTTFPTVQVGNVNTPVGSLADYLGIPPAAENPWFVTDEIVSAFPFGAYQLIYNEYYRDENLISPIVDRQTFMLVDGTNNANTALFGLRKRAWQHDYFTSALPFAQKGQPVNFPLAIEDVRVKILTETPGDVGNEVIWDNIVASDIAQSFAQEAESATLGGPPGKLFIKGTDVVGTTTINDLRRAMRLQEYLEKNARGGTRYIEHILMHFGVRSSDKRLQRPEYITGTMTPVMISEVLNTAGFDNGTDELPQGNMSGHGVSVTNGKYGSYYCEEHGYIMGIMSVMPVTAYAQGLERHWLKTVDPTQYFYSSFANIGEQPIANREIAAYLSLGTDDDQQEGAFGYVPRYAEYKYMNSRLAGEFRTTLDYWTETRLFATQPQLNQEFIECSPANRIFAVTDPLTDHLFCHIANNVTATRGMPKYGSPTF